MAKSVNRTFLLGHVGKNPEVGTTPGGTLAVNFSLATTDREKDHQGNWSDRTEWHNLVAYGRTAEIVRDYVSKGTQLFIQGKIQRAPGMTRNPGRSGTGRRYSSMI